MKVIASKKQNKLTCCGVKHNSLVWNIYLMISFLFSIFQAQKCAIYILNREFIHSYNCILLWHYTFLQWKSHNISNDKQFQIMIANYNIKQSKMGT